MRLCPLSTAPRRLQDGVREVSVRVTAADVTELMEGSDGLARPSRRAGGSSRGRGPRDGLDAAVTALLVHPSFSTWWRSQRVSPLQCRSARLPSKVLLLLLLLLLSSSSLLLVLLPLQVLLLKSFLSLPLLLLLLSSSSLFLLLVFLEMGCA